MDEMANAIAQKTGLAPEQAKAAAQAAVDFMMTKLPAPLADQVKSGRRGRYGRRREESGRDARQKIDGVAQTRASRSFEAIEHA